MSFNKTIVPEVPVLEKYLKDNGSESFYLKYIKRTDAMMGDSDGMDFIEEFEIKYDKNDTLFYKLD